ncbi:MAG: TIGR01212 family radical SAM protein [Eubacterium sp.]|nr:TIGR01212 family radical SAM protein [Eubacterium sp.]
MHYNSLNQHLKTTFGQKVYKLSISSGLSCPNRDGTLSELGCTFCSEGGSGDFATSASLSITEQIESAKEKVSKKIKDGKYIAYFQSFTNTYGPVDYLEKIYTEAISHPDVVALSIGTRPDCLGPEVLELLKRLNQVKPVWIELGLQTIHEETALHINRGYPLEVFHEAVKNLNRIGVDVIVHLILGLPGETRDMMLESVRYVSGLNIAGIKLQLLHVLKNTPLEKEYIEHPFELFSMEQYIDFLAECLSYIPPRIVIHRLTGDGPKRSLIAPLWSADKKRVLNFMNHRFDELDVRQGSNCLD